VDSLEASVEFVRYWRALVWSARIQKRRLEGGVSSARNALTILVDFGSYSWATDDVKSYRA
jgi:hypothetical protein